MTRGGTVFPLKMSTLLGRKPPPPDSKGAERGATRAEGTGNGPVAWRQRQETTDPGGVAINTPSAPGLVAGTARGSREPAAGAARFSSAPGSPHTTAPASPAGCSAWEELRAGTLLRVFWHFTNSSVFPMQVEESRGGTDM